jgi:hypothetical protein
MGYPVAYLSGNTTTYETGMFKRGTIGQNQAAALTGNYRWWNGIDVTSSQYLIYSDTFTTSASTAANATPAAWATPDLADQSLLNLINTLPERIGKLPFTYLPVALQWIQSTGRYFLLNNGYENIVTNGLVHNLDAGWYLSYSGTGTNWKDLTSNGNNGTLTNGPTFNNNNGGSIAFDGVDDNVVLGNVLNIGTGDMTINSWINLSSGNVDQYIYSKSFYGGANYRYGYQLNSSNQVVGFVQGNGGSDIYPNGSTSLSLNTWYMVTMVINRNSNIQLYLNGVLEKLTGNATISQWAGLDFQSIFPARWASYTNSIGGFSPNFVLNGKIGIGQVYNRALNLTEITQNFNAQKTRFGLTADTIVTSGLTLNLDAGSVISYPTTGTSWYDVSYNNYNATLNNGPTFVSSGLSSSILFDGVDDNASTQLKPTSYNNTTQIVWYKWDGVNQIKVLTYLGRSCCNGFGFLIHDGIGGSIGNRVGVLYGGSFYNALNSGSTYITLSSNTWSQLAITRDTSITTLYLNGSVVGTTNRTPNNSTSYDFTYGDSIVGASGNVSNIQFYNRALSSSELTQNFNAVKSRYGL